MKRNHTMMFLFLLGATAAGCAADAPGDEDVDPVPPDQQPVPLTPQGRFRVMSEFDLATNAPGTVGDVVNYFIAATDEPDDPTKFIVEKIAEALPAGTVKNIVQGSIPFVAGYLNERLLEVAPDFVTKIVDVGDAFGQIAKQFGTIETYDIAANGVAVKNVTGLRFKVDNVDLEYEFADYGMQPVKVEGLQVRLEPTGKLTFASHKVPMKYGAALKLALDQAVIPMIDPSKANLGEFLKGIVNCQAVGQHVYNALGIGSPSTFESACNGGLVAGAQGLYSALDRIDGAALEFGLTGTSRAVDRNRDGKMDDIQTGVWTGELKYAGSPAPLTTAKFYGTKF
jgi:hypothetical protein